MRTKNTINKKMNFINLTPHDIILLCGNNQSIILKSNGVIRVSEETQKITEINNISIIKKKLSDIDKKDIKTITEILNDKNNAVIVSFLVAKKLKEMNFKFSDRVFFYW